MRYFRERYRNVDVLLVDDIQFIAGKESTQQEFFHTFDALYQQHKQIILTSDRPPRELKHLDDRMRTRFESGLTVDIQPPELELRIAIASSKAEALGLEIPYPVIQFIAENIKSSVRQLEGVIKRLHGYSTIFGNKIDMELAKRCIHDVVPSKSIDSTVEKTFERVCERYGVGVGDITGKRKQANIVIARHVATYILRQITDLSSIEIARYFSQDHSTILSAIKSVEKKIDDNPSFEEEVTKLIREIQE
jgi:chromosomal replication initiator protein